MSKKQYLFAFFGTILLFVSALLLFAVPKSDFSASAHDIDAERFDPSEFSQLSYGIYWYQSGNDIPVAAKDATNYDPQKPTLIYAHGMKFNHEGLMCREGLSLKDNNYEYMTKKAGFPEYRYEGEFYQTLIDRGYNVGVFFWNQLADCYFNEDDKFWVSSPMNGLYYTYVDSNGNYCSTETTDETNPSSSVAVLYRDALVEALGKDFSGHLQLVGHSMGGQLTLAVSQALCAAYDRGDVSSRYLPDRVTLLDPFLGSTPCYGEVEATGEKLPTEGKPTALLAAEAAENIAKHGIPIEGYAVNEMAYSYYNMPLLGVGDKELIAKIKKIYADNITWVYLKFLLNVYTEVAANLGGMHVEMPFVPTHTMAVDYYFSTMYMNTETDNAGVTVPSFKVEDDYIRRLKGTSFRQEPDERISKPNPIYMHDCSYVRIDGVTQKNTTATDLTTAVSGTVTEREQVLQVRLLLDGEVIQETSTLKGKYLFADVEEGEYTVAFYYNDQMVGEKTNVCVSSYDDAVTVEKTETPLPEEKKFTLTRDQLIFGIAGLIFVIAVIIELAVLSRKRKKC